MDVEIGTGLGPFPCSQPYCETPREEDFGVRTRTGMCLSPNIVSFPDQDNYKELFGALDNAFLVAYAIGMFIRYPGVSSAPLTQPSAHQFAPVCLESCFPLGWRCAKKKPALPSLHSGIFGERLPLRYYLSGGMVLSGLFTALFGLGYFWDIHVLWYFIIVQVCPSLVSLQEWEAPRHFLPAQRRRRNCRPGLVSARHAWPPLPNLLREGCKRPQDCPTASFGHGTGRKKHPNPRVCSLPARSAMGWCRRLAGRPSWLVLGTGLGRESECLSLSLSSLAPARRC